MKSINKITQRQLDTKGVSALATRPNEKSRFGESGLSATELKFAFDRLATFLAQKINELIDAVGGEAAAEYIRLNMVNGEDRITDLDELIEAIGSGTLAEKFLYAKQNASAESQKSLQAVLNEIDRIVSENREGVSDNCTDIETLFRTSFARVENGGIDGNKVLRLAFQNKEGLTVGSIAIDLSDMQGEKGDPGFSVSSDGHYFFTQSDDGYLILHYTGDVPPNYEIREDGHLYLSITEDDPAIDVGLVKGEKGDPFTYDDLTPEQIESLKGAEGGIGPRGYSGMMPKATSISTSGDVEIPVSTEFIIPALTGDTQLSLATPTQELASYAVMWTCVIEQGETAYDVVLPAVHWTLGIAPTFAANTKTKIWLTADGDSIQGVWQAWSV